MLPFGRAGVALIEAGPAFARPSEPVIGNQLPPWTGSHTGPADKPAPSPPGQVVAGQTGDFDGFSGADPSRPRMSPSPRVDVYAPEQETVWRNGIIGFNDQLQVRDRHAFWHRGHQRTGITPSVPGNPPNQHSDGPQRPDLDTVNISVNPQIGSDHTAFADDLRRPYTWLGQQDGPGYTPVYGGVPGMWVPYGTRGGVPYAIVDPTNGEGGPEQIYQGPAHGLHSDTYPDGKKLIDRYKSTPQMRPVRLDRPDNSRIAGQSFSQTVPRQGQQPPSGRPQGRGGAGLSLHIRGRGWAGK